MMGLVEDIVDMIPAFPKLRAATKKVIPTVAVIVPPKIKSKFLLSFIVLITLPQCLFIVRNIIKTTKAQIILI